MIAEILRYLDSSYAEHETDIDSLDTSGYPLMDGPLPLCTILLTYLLVVLWFGPRHMKAREPYDVKRLIFIYNLSQILLNGVGLYFCFTIKHARGRLYDIFVVMSANRRPVLTNEEMDIGYCYWALKVYDLMDTIFFVAKKKYQQITFLHLYHHVTTCFMVWFFLKYIPVEQCGAFGLVNTLVHFFMYTYYLLASLGPKYQKYLWWKKYLTILQMTQFVAVGLYTLISIMTSSNLSKLASYVLGTYAASFFILFHNYFRKEYSKPKKN